MLINKKEYNIASFADLRDANLRGANLYGANLSCANLYGANLEGQEEILKQFNILPDGDIIVYKKLCNNVICTLRIPADAKRSSATTNKCRAEYAEVLEGNGVSQYDLSFTYNVGEIVKPTELFNKDRWNECSSGIHFFLTKEEAEAF